MLKLHAGLIGAKVEFYLYLVKIPKASQGTVEAIWVNPISGSLMFLIEVSMDSSIIEQAAADCKFIRDESCVKPS